MAAWIFVENSQHDGQQLVEAIKLAELAKSSFNLRRDSDDLTTSEIKEYAAISSDWWFNKTLIILVDWTYSLTWLKNGPTDETWALKF